MTTTIEVNHRSTSNPYVALQWLRSLPNIAAFDFEAAVRYTPEELERYQQLHDYHCISPTYKIHLNSKLKATALSHPAHVAPTHLSVATSESEAFVIILDTPRITQIVMNWLVSTPITQIWHNASYDFKLIHYYTAGKLPKNYEDTAILAKSILNHVEVQKASVKLKELMGYKYGAWAVAADYFDLSQMYNPDLIYYAATDAAATFCLWEEMQEFLAKEEE